MRGGLDSIGRALLWVSRGLDAMGRGLNRVRRGKFFGALRVFPVGAPDELQS